MENAESQRGAAEKKERSRGEPELCLMMNAMFSLFACSAARMKSPSFSLSSSSTTTTCKSKHTSVSVVRAGALLGNWFSFGATGRERERNIGCSSETHEHMSTVVQLSVKPDVQTAGKKPPHRWQTRTILPFLMSSMAATTESRPKHHRFLASSSTACPSCLPSNPVIVDVVVSIL